MTDERTPRPGQVYRDEAGQPLLFVRTEQRRVHADDAEPGDEAHMFLVALPDRRMHALRYFPAKEPLPPSLTLEADPDLAQRAERLDAEVLELRRENAALTLVMRNAVECVPTQTAAHLRQLYRAGLGLEG